MGCTSSRHIEGGRFGLQCTRLLRLTLSGRGMRLARSGWLVIVIEPQRSSHDVSPVEVSHELECLIDPLNEDDQKGAARRAEYRPLAPHRCTHHRTRLPVRRFCSA